MELLTLHGATMWVALLTLKSSIIVGYTLKLRLKCNLEKWTHPLPACSLSCCVSCLASFAAMMQPLDCSRAARSIAFQLGTPRGRLIHAHAQESFLAKAAIFLRYDHFIEVVQALPLVVVRSLLLVVHIHMISFLLQLQKFSRTICHSTFHIYFTCVL